MKMNMYKASCKAAFVLSAIVMAMPASAQLEPDRKISSIGKWNVSTALYGAGCVASMEYSDGNELSISGERIDDLTLLVTVDSKLFSTKLDGSEENAPSVEVVLANARWGNVEPYGYRGTPGIVLKLDQAFLGSFVASDRIRITELGHEKVSIELENPGQVMDGLRACFKSGGVPSNPSVKQSPSIQALEGNWYGNDQSVCKGRAGEVEGLLTFRNMRRIAYEENCKIIGSKASGQLLTLRMMCASEGMKQRSTETVEFLGDNKIRIISKEGGKTYSSVFNRCPPRR